MNLFVSYPLFSGDHSHLQAGDDEYFVLTWPPLTPLLELLDRTVASAADTYGQKVTILGNIPIPAIYILLQYLAQAESYSRIILRDT